MLNKTISDNYIHLKALDIRMPSNGIKYQDKGYVFSVDLTSLIINIRNFGFIKSFFHKKLVMDYTISQNIIIILLKYFNINKYLPKQRTFSLPYQGKSIETWDKSNSFLTKITIFQEKSYDPQMDIFIKGHEETHALQSFGRLDLLDKELYKFFNKKIILPNNTNSLTKEQIADVGGFLALLKTGIHTLSKSMKKNIDYDTDLYFVYHLYISNKLKLPE